MAPFANVTAFLRQHGLAIVGEAMVNVVLPFAIYDCAKARVGDVNALLASSGPPIAWSVIEFARRRRLDAFSLLIVAGIALSLLAFIGGGSARFLQLRENLVSAVIGLAFLGSAAIGKPLIYQLARATMRRRSAAEAAEFEKLREYASFRRTMMLMTLVWGFGLIAQTALACVLVFNLSIAAYLVVAPVLGYGSMGALGLWTFWYGRRQRRRGAAHRAEAAQRSAALAAERQPWS
jgi:multisubunit Na+/H+ antiporter MnhC subunit